MKDYWFLIPAMIPIIVGVAIAFKKKKGVFGTMDKPIPKNNLWVIFASCLGGVVALLHFIRGDYMSGILFAELSIALIAQRILSDISFGISISCAWAVFALMSFSRGVDMVGILCAAFSIVHIVKSIFRYRKAKSK